MIKTIISTVSTVALVAGGIAVSGMTEAGAAKPTITAGPGSSVNCSIAAKAKVKGPFRDPWIAADHQDDPNPAVVALPDTEFGPPGPVIVKAKAKSVSCSGTVTDGVNTAAVTLAKVSLINNPSFPGSTDPATCAGLIAPDPLNPSTARYDALIKWKASGAKVTNTVITAAEIASGGSFEISGGTISGSFAGGTSTTSANPDLPTLAQFLSSTEIAPESRQLDQPRRWRSLPAEPEAQGQEGRSDREAEEGEGHQEAQPRHRHSGHQPVTHQSNNF